MTTDFFDALKALADNEQLVTIRTRSGMAWTGIPDGNAGWLCLGSLDFVVLTNLKEDASIPWIQIRAEEIEAYWPY